MGQTEIVRDMIQGQLLVYAVLAFAERRHTPPDRGDMLADTEVKAFNEGGVDLPAAGREHLLDGLQGPEDHPVAHPHQAPPAYRLDHLRIAQPGQRHPAGLRRGACRLLARWLHPLPKVTQQRRGVLLEAVGEKERYTARCE